MDWISLGLGLYRWFNNTRYTLSRKPDTTGFNPLPDDIIDSYNRSRLLGAGKYICNAPFVNMYFGVDGRVTVCCYNRNFPIGDIREKNLDAMWHGDAAQILREHVAHNDFSLGCNLCEDGLRAGSYHLVEAAAYDPISPSSGELFPRKMVFELSGTCNLACKMCNGTLSSTYRKYYENAPPHPDIYPDSFVEQLEPYLPHLKRVNFLGGEPFLIEMYYKIWERLVAVNPGCKIHVQTNGMVLNNKVKTILSKGKFYVGISIDSLEKEKFEEIRKFANLDRWSSNMAFFKEYTQSMKTDLSLVFTPMIDNMYEVPDFLKFTNDNNAFFYLNTLTEPEEMAITSVDVDTLEKYLQFLQQDFSFPAVNYIQKVNLLVYRSFVSHIETALLNKQEIRRREQELAAAALRKEKAIQDAFDALSDKSFRALLNTVLERISQEYERSELAGSLPIDSFLQEFEENMEKENQKSPDPIKTILKKMIIAGNDEFGRAIQPYLQKSIKKYLPDVYQAMFENTSIN